MSEKQKVELTIREAIPTDAAEILQVLNQIRKETDFLTMDESDISISVEEEEKMLARIFDSVNNALLLAIVDEKIVGTISIHADYHPRVAHIGEIGISILKEHWGYGLGTILMEEAIAWASESGIIRRLQLTVQDRNDRAIHIYEKLGFQTEAIMERGAIAENGEFLPVHLMSLMIN
ncbi:MAG: GNAT family N-acetyltransferase [Lactobacillales bacterium]|jgi:RimJ/RimL family protein N-acetyltransferase|nr:GNAT family N-acetyltransferase [Lactobacillales bacterium]